MSIVVRFALSNVTKEQYDARSQSARRVRRLAARGCRFHACFGDEQDIRVSEVWESPEQLDALGEKLGPRLEEAGIELTGQPEVFEAHIVETF